MNIKKIESLLNQIENAAMLMVDDSPYLHSVSVSEIEERDTNEVLYMNWHDDEGQEYSVTITERGLSDAIVTGNKITLEDHEGYETIICLYDIVPEPIVTVW